MDAPREYGEYQTLVVNSELVWVFNTNQTRHQALLDYHNTKVCLQGPSLVLQGLLVANECDSCRVDFV